MIAVTGGAGFIGSALVHELNRRGISEILIVDAADHKEKRHNLAALKYAVVQDKITFLASLRQRRLPALDAILHMGACSSTTETDWDYLRKNNYEYTKALARYALEKSIRFVYASSAATYGDGANGYEDDETNIETLQPLNLYGKSKQDFDLWARAENAFDHIVGLKYFNVYGPNEYHKGDMQSLIRKGYFQIKETGKLRLFKSYKPQYQDGGQERDFLYIKDAVAMTLFFLDTPGVSGLFNVGSGVARNWNDLAAALFKAMGVERSIEYIDMPLSIRDQYQYHTRAVMEKMQSEGYKKAATALEAGIEDYVREYLMPGRRLGEK